MGMKAVIPAGKKGGSCIVYWTGRVRFHVGVLTYCAVELDASEGVLQVPDDVPACEECEKAIEDRRYPTTRG